MILLNVSSYAVLNLGFFPRSQAKYNKIQKLNIIKFKSRTKKKPHLQLKNVLFHKLSYALCSFTILKSFVIDYKRFF